MNGVREDIPESGAEDILAKVSPRILPREQQSRQFRRLRRDLSENISNNSNVMLRIYTSTYIDKVTDTPPILGPETR